jgi:hypothetical protein
MIGHVLCDGVHRGTSVCSAAHPRKMRTNGSSLQFVAIRLVCPIRGDPIAGRQLSTYGCRARRLSNPIQSRKMSKESVTITEPG